MSDAISTDVPPSWSTTASTTRSPRSPSTRQHNRNALSRQLVTELFDRLEPAEADDDVRGSC